MAFSHFREMWPTMHSHALGLEIGWFFDEHIYQTELRQLFESGAGYVAHELLIAPGETAVELPWLAENCALERFGADFFLAHRQKDGSIRREPLKAWNGLLFRGPRSPEQDLGLGRLEKFLRLDGYEHGHTLIHDYPFGWKTFVETHLDDYHVDYCHPGLSGFLDCGELEVAEGPWWSWQAAPAKQGRFSAPGPWEEWARLAESFGGEREIGGLWLCYYPGLMVERYPFALAVSQAIPTGVESCRNVVELYFPQRLMKTDLPILAKRAYLETLKEDEAICAAIHAGRRALWKEGRSEEGPYQEPLESGLRHFHDFLRQEVGRTAQSENEIARKGRKI